jgi:hypothetical protein
VVGDERSRLHQIVDRLPDEEVELACQLLELLARGGRAALRPEEAAADADEAEDETDRSAAPETIAKLAQLDDDELLRLDELLETDREAAKQFWRERFGEELADDLAPDSQP